MNLIWRPEIEVEGVHGTREVSLTTHLLTERKIFLEGEIDSDMASSFIAQLLCLQADSPEPVTHGSCGKHGSSNIVRRTRGTPFYPSPQQGYDS